MKNKQLRDSVDRFDTDWILGEIASGIDLASAPAETLTRGEQWKVWLSLGEKAPEDLIAELAKAPGRPKAGEPIADVPVPWYAPGPIQWEAHTSPERVVLVAGGWRGGKSKWLAAQLLPYMFKEYAHIWVVANDYHLARDEFNYIQMWLQWFNVPLAKDPSKPKEGQWQLVTKWGATLETMTGKDEDKIEMASLNACGIAEAGQTESTLLGKVRGRVFQKRGKIFISGSLVAAQPWYINALKKYKNGDGDERGWRSFSIPSYDNLAVFPLGKDDPEIAHMQREMSSDEFARKVLAEPVAPEGLVFSEFDEDLHVVPMKIREDTEDAIITAMREMAFGAQPSSLVKPQPIKDGLGFRITGWQIPTGYPLEVAIDPGYNPGRYAVLCIARTDKEILVLDEVYETEKTGEEVIQICQDRWWWPQVKSGVIDVASKQHQMGMSEYEKWRRFAGFTLRTQFVPVIDGVARYRTFLRDPDNSLPRLFIDPQCDNLRWEHSQYRYPPHRAERKIQENPVDWANHAIKALTYFMVVRFGFVDRTGGTTTKRYIDKLPSKQRGGSDFWREETSTWDY